MEGGSLTWTTTQLRVGWSWLTSPFCVSTFISKFSTTFWNVHTWEQTIPLPYVYHASNNTLFSLMLVRTWYEESIPGCFVNCLHHHFGYLNFWIFFLGLFERLREEGSYMCSKMSRGCRNIDVLWSPSHNCGCWYGHQ